MTHRRAARPDFRNVKTQQNPIITSSTPPASGQARPEPDEEDADGGQGSRSASDHAGKFLWFHLKAPNGEIIAANQGHESKASAEKGVAAIKTHGLRREGRRPQRDLEPALT